VLFSIMCQINDQYMLYLQELSPFHYHDHPLSATETILILGHHSCPHIMLSVTPPVLLLIFLDIPF
jgi:hypothetical protein